VDAVRFATVPSYFYKASIKTWKNNGCFFFLVDPSTKDLYPYSFEKPKASISDDKYYQNNKQVRVL
jgi:hypothetical protein